MQRRDFLVATHNLRKRAGIAFFLEYLHWIGKHFPRSIVCCQEAQGLRSVDFDKVYSKRGRLPRRRLIPSAKSAGLVFAVPADLCRRIQGSKDTEYDGVAVHSIVVGAREDATIITNVHLPYKGEKSGAEK